LGYDAEVMIPPDKGASSADGNSSHEDTGGSPSLRYLLGGIALLQVVLTTLGVNNGGIAAMVINDRLPVYIGFFAVLLAVAVGAVIVASQSIKSKPLIVVGTLLLFVGIGITGYAALAAPAIAKAPSINTALTEPAGQLMLTAHIKASGIPDDAQYWIEIDAREYVPERSKEGVGGKYVPLGTPLYQAQLGADSQGNVDDIVNIPLLPHDTYNVISVEAWSGAHAGPCGSLEVPGGANLTQAPNTTEAHLEVNARAGCVVIRLPVAADPHKERMGNG
jgi:hypothetical protein